MCDHTTTWKKVNNHWSFWLYADLWYHSETSLQGWTHGSIKGDQRQSFHVLQQTLTGVVTSWRHDKLLDAFLCRSTVNVAQRKRAFFSYNLALKYERWVVWGKLWTCRRDLLSWLLKTSSVFCKIGAPSTAFFRGGWQNSRYRAAPTFRRNLILSIGYFFAAAESCDWERLVFLSFFFFLNILFVNWSFCFWSKGTS